MKRKKYFSLFINDVSVNASGPPTMTAELVGHKTSPAIVRPVEGHNRAAPLLSAQDKLQ